MKPKLFENNLTVHKLLGDVSEDEFDVRYLAVDKVKEEVVELYQVWDSSMTSLSQQLLEAEEDDKSLKSVESDLAGLSSFLRRTSGGLVSALTSTDSGLSEASEASEASKARLTREISQQETRLAASQHRLRGLARGARGARGEVRREVRRDLAESGRQLALLRSLLPSVSSQAQGDSRSSSSRRRRLLTYWSLATCWLMLLFGLLLAVMRPRCCDHSSLSYFFLLQYTGGARPI